MWCGGFWLVSLARIELLADWRKLAIATMIGMPATAHLTAALASSHFACSILLIHVFEATGVLCSLLTALTALCSAPVMLLAWLRACVSTVVLLMLAWLRNAAAR